MTENYIAGWVFQEFVEAHAVAAGLVASLARPCGNTTGISILATELDGKRQEILVEMVPAARRMAMLGDANTAAPEKVRALREVTRARGVEVAIHLAERPEQIVPEIEKASRAGAEALNVLASPILCATPRHLRAYGCATPACLFRGSCPKWGRTHSVHHALRLALSRCHSASN